MSEQLWYTWSNNGFGFAKGERVRAASANLTDVEGQRVRSFISLVDYKLSSDTNLFLPPPEAPLCLAFLKAVYKQDSVPKQESVLIQKSHRGLDGVGRPGAFFSHLIAELPEVPSPSPKGQIPFSAREAIALWRARDLWRNSEDGLLAGKKDLEAIPPVDLYTGKYAGPLNEQAVMQIAELFSLVMQAFLTLALSGGDKRLYLAGTPDTVATLIWGITHALPRTLTIMSNMTFSTFEANIEGTSKPSIVGTCWLPNHLKKGHENAFLNFPPSYYQPNNPYGLAINCDTMQYTPFTPHALVAEYTQYVLDCFSKGSMGKAKLMMMLDKAEKRNISTMTDFFSHYTASCKILSKEEIMRELQNIYQKVAALISKAEAILQLDTLAAAAKEVAQLENAQSEVEILTQDNIQQSLMTLMIQDEAWWNAEGQVIIGKLYQLALRFPVAQLNQMGEGFGDRILTSRPWSKSQGLDLIGVIQPFVPDSHTYRNPSELVTAFAQTIVRYIQNTQTELKKALFPLASSIADQLVQTIVADDYQSIIFWNNALAACVDQRPAPTEVWAHLLSQLANAGRYTETYKRWWEPIKKRLAQLRSPQSANASGSLFSAFSYFLDASVKQLVAAIREDRPKELPLWGDIIDTLAVPQSEPNAWVSLLNQLGAIPSYTAAYEQWWKTYGTTRQRDLLALANTNRELQNALSFLMQRVVAWLQTAIRSGDAIPLPLCEGIIALASPSLHIDLLLNLRDVLTAPVFFQWWKEQGYALADDLRRRAENNEGRLVQPLSTFAQAVVKPLSECILSEVQQGQGQYERSIDFYFQMLEVTAPTQDSTAWSLLLQKLTDDLDYRRVDWKLRSALLQRWKPLANVNDSTVQTLLRLWCEVSWEHLDAFLSLDLPEAWYGTAITKALDTYPGIVREKVLGTVESHYELFAKTLQELILVHQTQPRVIAFFNALANNRYKQILSLLDALVDRLLRAGNSQRDIAEQLLQMTQITTDEDVVDLLEHHCKEWLAKYELPLTMLRLIERYFDHFDVDYLDADPTRALLLRLQQRAQPLPPQLQQSVESWYKISDFLTRPQVSYQSLRDLSENLDRLSPDMQRKLIDKLVLLLVGLVTSDGVLTLIIYVLGRGSELQLLQEMAKVAGNQYGKERPPVRIALYARTILVESNRLQSSEKESFIDTCLLPLFKDVDAKTREKCLSELPWMPTLVDESKKALGRLRSKALTKARDRLRKAIADAFISAIVEAFDPDLKPYLNAQEDQIVELALSFEKAYGAGDDVAMLQAHQALKPYYYTPGPLYTPEQVSRIQLARQRTQKQQTSGRLPAVNVPKTVSPAGGNVSSSPHVGSVQNPNAGPTNTPAPAPPSVQTTKEQVAATVKGISISVQRLDFTEAVQRQYLSHRMGELQRSIDEVNQAKKPTPEMKQERDWANQEISKIRKLFKDAREQRKGALHNLIDDVFIKERINMLHTSQPPWWSHINTGMQNDADRVYPKVGPLLLQNTPFMQLKQPEAIDSIMIILRVFTRRNYFDEYLRNVEQTTVEPWLKELKEREKDHIKIDYKQAGIPAPRGIKKIVDDSVKKIKSINRKS